MLFFVVVLACLAASSEATFCQMSDPNTLHIYPSPNNCSTFYACVDRQQIEYDCIQAPLFIPFSAESICVTPCPSKSTTKRTSSKTSLDLPDDPILFPDSPMRTIVCPPTGDTKAIVAKSCTDYIDCHEGIGTKKSCPAGQEFSPNKFECVIKQNSDCPKQKPKGSYHIKCRYDKGDEPVYFPSNVCPEFHKCANQLAWDVKCAQYSHWNNDLKTCEWADKFDCALTNSH